MHAGEMCTCQVARTLTTHESRCTLWRVFGSMACCFLAKLVLGPPHYHDTFQTCQVARTLTILESRCTLWRVFGSMACCFLAKLVLGPPHYHDTFQTCQTWRVGVCMLAKGARATRRTHTHHTRVEMHLVEYGVLFFGQVGAWSTTLP